MFVDADECRADATFEVAQMRLDMDEEMVDVKLEMMKSEERAREAERYKKKKMQDADDYFDDTVKMSKELEKEAKAYIEQCYKEYNSDFDKCKILLTNLRSDISELEKSVDEIWDEDFKVDTNEELKEYLEGHCVVVGGKQVSLLEDFEEKIREKKRRRSDSTGDSVKKIQERVTSRIDSIEDVERFLQMRCSGEDFTEGFER